MSDAIDELYTRWQANPKDAAVTLALCDALRGSTRMPLIDLVGNATQRDHADNVAALIATARMYMEAQKLQDAQNVLVTAGRLAPRDGTVYRWLGEVLLRRGDAERAEKVFERALFLGADDSDTRMWAERAKVFRPIQAKSGTLAVAAEIAKAQEARGRHAEGRPFGEPEEVTTDILGSQKKLVPPPVEPPKHEGRSDNSEVFVAPPDDIPTDAPTRPAAPVHVARAHFSPSSSSASAQVARAHSSPPSSSEQRTPAGVVRAELASFEDATTLSNSSPLHQQKPIDMTAPPPRATPPPPRTSSSRPPPLPAAHADPMAGGPVAAQAVTGGAAPLAQSPGRSKPPPPLPPYVPPPAMAPLPPLPPVGLAIDASVPSQKRTPDPRDVLDALALAGIFEPNDAATASAWARAERGPRRIRSTIVLVVSMLLFVGSGYGLFRYIRDSRAKQHALAEQILGEVETDIHAAKPGALGAAEQQIGRAFDLDSRSPRAALAWVRERVLVGLLRGGQDVAFEDAIRRARDVHVPEDRLAFAPVASFLFQGDTAGAAALLPKWDAVAERDAFYQLVAGATLERAGAPRAADRYAAAARLDPELLVADVMLARAVAIDGDAQKAGELARIFRLKYPDRAEGVALVSLAWARDPTRANDEPPEANDTLTHAAELPAMLAFVPHAIEALRAIDKRATEDARRHIEKGLAVADGPGVASWLGTLALDIGDERLARKAALAAVGFSAVHVPARVLAARVALLGDRLDEALKATEELEASSPDVAVVRAAVAYERVDADGLARALDAVPADAKKLPFLAPLAYAPDVLFARIAMTGDKLVGTADDEAPWSDLLAMDMALDGGDLDAARRIAQLWKGNESLPLRAVRLSRLARYTGRLEDADTASDSALRGGTATVRDVSERVLLLVARGHNAEVGPLLARYPLVLGPLASWLSAYAAASAGKVDDARGKIAQLDPPPPTSPVTARVIAALALGATRDHRRGNAYVKALLASTPSHPDAGAAALALGGRKMERAGRPPTYAGP